MTKQELLSLPDLTISEEKPGLFIHISVSDGKKITSYKDGCNINEYASFKEMYGPIQDNYPDYGIITDEQDAEFKKQQRTAQDIKNQDEEEGIFDDTIPGHENSSNENEDGAEESAQSDDEQADNGAEQN